MKRAVIISGSERRNGITNAVAELSKTLLAEKAVEATIVRLCELDFSACDGCGEDKPDCNYRPTPCEKHDAMQHVVDMMVDADILIYATPVHGFGAAHLMQIFIERIGVGYLRFTRPLQDKVGGIIVVGRKYHLGQVHDQIMNNLLLNRLIMPGAGFPVLIHGDEATRSITDTEEYVALEQMLSRIVNVDAALDRSKLNTEKRNERELKILKEKHV